MRARFFSCIGLWFVCGVAAAVSFDIPAQPPDDEVMATPFEVQGVTDWAGRSFAGRTEAGAESRIEVEVRRQDHSVLHFGQSCIDTPMRIGQRNFAHGLGTHANSGLALHLPAGAKRFRAFAGIDNNDDTGGVRGSAQFSVEANAKTIWRSEILKGGMAPAPVDLEIPEGAHEIVLKVDATADGPSHDQADWADASVILADGSVVWADAGYLPFMVGAPPFSFIYGGSPSADLLKNWDRKVEREDRPNQIAWRVRWVDPRTGLGVTVEAAAFKRYAAVDWVLYFENTGPAPTPVIEDVQALDVQLQSGYYRRPVVLHQLIGDVCGEKSFLPTEASLEPGKETSFGPTGGRSSNGAFPFFNAQYADQGMIVAVGWSGQWSASLRRTQAGPARLQAGMEKTRLRLNPGERIRSPRILIMPWKGDRILAHNRFRRLMLFEYVPKLDGRPLQLPVAWQCFDRYNWIKPDWGTEAGQLRAATAARDVGCDTHWLDAAWFEGGFPNGVGNWVPKAQGFPNGLKPLGAACRQMGLKFLVWFEPERVAAGSLIAREHPDFVHGGANGGLFRLDQPGARQWLTDLLSKRITESGIDVYRNDFNIDPLEFWRRNDPPGREGITEIRYVEGHYALWDDLRQRHQGLWIDNCASGGRRIDIETCRRAAPLWRSDTSCSPGHADWNQVQAFGLSLYIPLFCACAWTHQAYDLRAAATGGIICQFPFLDDNFNLAEARAALDEVKQNRPFWYGDFYPLTRCSISPDAFIAYQFHRGDLDAGIVLAFRRNECPYPVLQANLRGLKPEKVYAVQLLDEARRQQDRTARGKELMSDLELRLPAKGTSLLVRYQAAP